MLSARQICTKWNKAIQNIQKLQNSLDLTGHDISASLLPNIIKPNLLSLNLSKTNINKQMMTWLLQRLPSLRHLFLCSLDWTGPVSSLTTLSLTSLTSLSLDSVTGLNDAALSQILRPRDDTKKSSLVNLRSLDLSRTSITDISLRYITQNLSLLRYLRLRGCDKLTEAGLIQIGDSSLYLSKNLWSEATHDCGFHTF